MKGLREDPGGVLTPKSTGHWGPELGLGKRQARAMALGGKIYTGGSEGPGIEMGANKGKEGSWH